MTAYATLTAGLLARKGQASPVAPTGFPMVATHTQPRPATRRETGLVPRGLTRRQAAVYVGVSPTTFKKLVTTGVFGAPMLLADRRRWDRLAIDHAFDRMSGHPGSYPAS